MKYSPFPRRCSHAGHFDSSSFLLSLSFIFLPSSAFDCFLGVYHIELFSLSRKPYSFFSSLSQLINNRESTSLERSTSCLPNRTAGVSPWESLWACERHITCHPRGSTWSIAAVWGRATVGCSVFELLATPQDCLHSCPPERGWQMEHWPRG